MTKDWYFQDGDQRIGPIEAAALKQLAMSGRVRPETLVWKDGMPAWAPALSVKGLISASATAAPPVHPSPAVAPPPAFPASPTADWHPFDRLVEAARQSCPPDLPAAISRAAGVAGLYSTYAAALVTLIYGIVLAIHTDELSVVGIHAAFALAMLGVQYATGRLLDSIDRTIRRNPSALPTSAIPDATAVLAFLGGVGGFAGLLAAEISAEGFGFGLAAVVVLAIGSFMSLTALHYPSLAVSERAECLASEEAIGILAFFVKLLLRCCPMFFLAAVVAGTSELGRLLIRVVNSSGAQFNLQNDAVQSGVLMGLLLNAVAIPIYAYLSAVVYYLTLDVVSALVSLPAKIDAIGRKNEST